MRAGGALVMPSTMAIMTDVFTAPAERARAVGIWSAVSGLGVAIGPTAGGWLLAHYSWGSIFAVNLPVVALALIGGWFAVPASAAPGRPRWDPAGTVLAVLASGTFTHTIIEAQPSGWASSATVLRGLLSLALLRGPRPRQRPRRAGGTDQVLHPADQRGHLLHHPGHDDGPAATRRRGLEIKPGDLAVLSPYLTMRINRFGVYATEEINIMPEQYDAHLPDIDLTLEPVP
jgi:hypothetical protein